MAPTAPDFRLEVYKALRDEITHHIQAMGALLTAALTATAAIGTLALSKAAHTNVLLVLPFVLSGLALVQVNHQIQIRRMSEYIRTYIWPWTPGSHSHASIDEHPVPSWEEWIAQMRMERRMWNPARAADFIGNAVVFGVPSVASLAITGPAAWRSTPLSIAWVLGVVVVVGSAAIAAAVETMELVPGDKRPERPLPSEREPGP